MKLSELSFREYIALEVFPSIIADPGKYKSSKEAAWLAFVLADAFLERAGREHEHKDHGNMELLRRAEKAERSLEILRDVAALKSGGQIYAAEKDALLEIWQFLGVDSQANAMGVLKLWKADVAALLMAEKTHD